MNYLVTGGTGFIGKHLIAELLARSRKATVYVLVRRGSKNKFNALSKELDAGGRLIAVTGDLSRSFMGVSAAKRRELEGNIDHVFHLAAIYDLQADGETQWAANVDGTRNAVRRSRYRSSSPEGGHRGSTTSIYSY